MIHVNLICRVCGTKYDDSYEFSEHFYGTVCPKCRAIDEPRMKKETEQMVDLIVRIENIWREYRNLQVENKMFLAGKDATEALREGLDVNKHGMRMGDIMGMAVICSTIVPDNELWFIQNGKLIQKYVIEKNGGKDVTSYELNRHYTTVCPECRAIDEPRMKKETEQIGELTVLIEKIWREYRNLQEHYHKLTGRDYMWLS